MNGKQTVVSEEMTPCELCQEVAVPLKGQRPCTNCQWDETQYRRNQSALDAAEADENERLGDRGYWR